jgi:hypothetical protein
MPSLGDDRDEDEDSPDHEDALRNERAPRSVGHQRRGRRRPRPTEARRGMLVPASIVLLRPPSGRGSGCPWGRIAFAVPRTGRRWARLLAETARSSHACPPKPAPASRAPQRPRGAHEDPSPRAGRSRSGRRPSRRSPRPRHCRDIRRVGRFDRYTPDITRQPRKGLHIAHGPPCRTHGGGIRFRAHVAEGRQKRTQPLGSVSHACRETLQPQHRQRCVATRQMRRPRHFEGRPQAVDIASTAWCGLSPSIRTRRPASPCPAAP